MPGLILASSSSYRRALLERLRVPFSCQAPGIDEAASKQTGQSPLAIVESLARQKAQAVAQRHPDSIVIGGDQAATIDGAVLDKPGTTKQAIAQLRQLSGREHQLLTAVAISHGKRLIEFVDYTRLTMRQLSDEEIERYVAAEQPLDCAGSYKVEGVGIALFERIDSHDQTAIMGLPLLRLCRELRSLGLAVP